jgi:hypothetical protein
MADKMGRELLHRDPTKQNHPIEYRLQLEEKSFFAGALA